MKYLNLIILFLIFSARTFGANSNLIEKQCGTYNLKGILVKDEKSKSLIAYKVAIGTRSEMTFIFGRNEDVDSVVGYLNKPTTLEVQIENKWSGNIVEISKLNMVKIRIPDPINSQDTGQFLISPKDCLR